MTWTLAIDTATVVCVGLSNGNDTWRARLDDSRAHAEQLTPLLNQVCAEAGITLRELDRIAVGVGPGPFTGLRVGVVTGLTLASLGRVPVTGVSSLDVVARQYVTSSEPPTGEFVAALDARRKELYWSHHRADGSRSGEPQVSTYDQLPDLPVTGPGALVHPGGITVVGPTALDAGVLARDLDLLPDSGTEPLYLRKPDAEVPVARKSTVLQPRLGLRRRP
ncbi:tRNA (adenosine(37)-N6)-threonylcarbamoyltransferase complex dimerization subunit type 1 TsaB [Aestuariimicrobium ganziense]|uniref:tRNA (adenosine(37)-N6)-threonylcarbamoyltransferase complex dimerization subunit type 1 TsaB n=1 Tax=Aestuariimicrobium ganziense TaxID=2773677 RepID=UPI0019457A05|nr:tRNA (adenosine(37)-N6)-threonylcarbamoyltransferase complex dimerization subunit type 1 TsaB [Aestuariimicrobium ganziense]